MAPGFRIGLFYIGHFPIDKPLVSAQDKNYPYTATERDLERESAL